MLSSFIDSKKQLRKIPNKLDLEKNQVKKKKKESPYLDSCGLLVPALNRVGEAWVNHLSDSKL